MCMRTVTVAIESRSLFFREVSNFSYCFISLLVDALLLKYRQRRRRIHTSELCTLLYYGRVDCSNACRVDMEVYWNWGEGVKSS